MCGCQELSTTLRKVVIVSYTFKPINNLQTGLHAFQGRPYHTYLHYRFTYSYTVKSNYKPTPEQKREYNKQAYLRRKEKLQNKMEEKLNNDII